MTDSKRAGLTRRWARWRDRLRERRALDLGYRIAVG
ncbi:TIGR02611 family protein, partial [Mycobacterium sp. ITM-2017-0098]